MTTFTLTPNPDMPFIMQTIFTDPVDEAIVAANEWVKAATPIIKAWFALDQIDSDLIDLPDTYMSEARGYLKSPMKGLYGMLAGIRDDHIDEVRWHGPSCSDDGTADWENQWDKAEEANDRLEREVTSVAEAIKAVGRTF